MFEKIDSANDELIIKKKINAISIYSKAQNKVYYIVANNNLDNLKELFEDDQIQKCSYELKEDIILLKQIGIESQNMSFDIKIAAYILNSATNQYDIKNLTEEYLGINAEDYIKDEENANTKNQISLFEETKLEVNKWETVKALMVYKLKAILEEKLKENDGFELFTNIEMPLAPVLAEMEYNGMYVDKEGLIEFGKQLQQRIE